MWKTLLFIFAGIGLAGLAFIVCIIGSFVSIGKVTEAKVKLESSNRILAPGVELEEIPLVQPPLEYEYHPGAGNLPVASDILINADLSFVRQSAVYDQDGDRQYLCLESPGYSFAFKGNKLYSVENQKLGQQQLAWNNSGLKSVGYAAYINRDYILIIGDDVLYKYPKEDLYLVNPRTLDKQHIASDPHYSFVRPPKVIQLDNFAGVVLIYYTGSYDYAYGGDSSRPKKSIVRIFNDQYVAGIDVVEMAFASGTIVDVQFENDTLILTGDPSRPSQSQQERLPPRFWRVNLASLLKQ
jgi:hypothetical protein